MSNLQSRIAVKVHAQRVGTPDFAPEIAEFDALAAKYAGQRDAEAAIATRRAAFTLWSLKDEAAATAQAKAVQEKYPGTAGATGAAQILAQLTPEAKAKRAAAIAEHKAKLDAVLNHPASEIDFTWSTRDSLKRLSDLRGQVVVLDFWATWCEPCIRSFPMVREDVKHFAGSPVTFLGVTRAYGKVSGLEPKPIDVKGDLPREYALTAEFMKKHDMTWPVVFSDEKTFRDYLVGGIPYIVIIDPLGKVRYLSLNPHFPDADIQGKITAILKEFNLPVPVAKEH